MFRLTLNWIIIFPFLSVVFLDHMLPFTIQRLVGFYTNTSYIVLSLPVLYLKDRLLVPSVVQYLYDCVFACRIVSAFP